MTRRLLLSIMTCALLSTALASEPAPRFGVTLSCGAAFPSASVGCFLERTVAAFGPLEVAVGVDARYSRTTNASLAGYALLGLYTGSWSVTLELHAPALLPTVGSPDWARLSFVYRF